MVYTLKDDGDYWEKRFQPLLAPFFPSYEKFWQIVIVPSSLREAGINLDLCPELYRDFELLAMCHYSVYFHFGVAFEILEECKEKYCLYDDFFFHLNAGADLVEMFLTYCAKVSQKIKVLGPREIGTLLSDDWKEKKSNFGILKEQIDVYRNAIAHDPRLGMIIQKPGSKLSVPTLAVLRERNEDERRILLTWSQVKALTPSTQLVDLDELANSLARRILSSIDSLWPELTAKFEEFREMEDYQKLACCGRYYPTDDKLRLNHLRGDTPLSASTSASGIYPSDEKPSSID